MNEPLGPPVTAVRDAVERALREDLEPLGDLSAASVPRDARARGVIAARHPGVVAGTACATEVFAQLDPAIELAWQADEGATVDAGTVVGVIEGPLATVLTGERTALNFLGHLSGIATLTSRFVAEVTVAGHPEVVIWDTRKTTPGLRALQKAAVRAGGGRNHRGNLSEWVMLKDNHLAHVGIAEAVAEARRSWPGRTVHVECDRVEQAVAAVDAGATAVLLDNMQVEQVADAVARVVATGRRAQVLLEVSGGVTLENVGAYAATGVDCISIGALTNSAPVLDLGLDLDVPGGG